MQYREDAFPILNQLHPLVFQLSPELTKWTSAKKISLHPMHPMLLKAYGDHNERQNFYTIIGENVFTDSLELSSKTLY